MEESGKNVLFWMKAMVYYKYGGPEVLTLVDVPKPIPKDNEVLIKVEATTVTSGDVRLRASDFPPLVWLPARFIFGLFRPRKRVLGHEFSGVVEGIGNFVTRFKKGDKVFGTTTMLRSGAHAEYISVPEKWKQGVIAKKPKNMTFTESACLPIGGMTALFLLERAGIKKGQNLLVYGASGSVGSFAIQIGKHFEAKVTGVCSAVNLNMVKSLGAHSTLDYTKEDFRELEPVFDVFLDAVGKVSKKEAKKVLRRTGKFVSVKMITQEKGSHLKIVKQLAEKEELKPFIDKVYSFQDIPKAHKYVDTGRKRGNVVVQVGTKS